MFFEFRSSFYGVFFLLIELHPQVYFFSKIHLLDKRGGFILGSLKLFGYDNIVFSPPSDQIRSDPDSLPLPSSATVYILITLPLARGIWVLFDRYLYKIPSSFGSNLAPQSYCYHTKIIELSVVSFSFSSLRKRILLYPFWKVLSAFIFCAHTTTTTTKTNS